VQGKYEFNFCPERLSERTVREAAGSDAVCIFVNDRADAKVVEELADMKVKLIALRCAGYNNVDLKACQGTQPPLSTSSHARTQTHFVFWRGRVCACCVLCVLCVCV
jgi:phosphoglycerate dehydrogenase-like enzyme